MVNPSFKFVDVKIKRSHGRCEECRRRKKKCDESKPSCSSCLKRHVDCVYKKHVRQARRWASKSSKQPKSARSSTSSSTSSTRSSVDSVFSTTPTSQPLDSADSVDSIAPQELTTVATAGSPIGKDIDVLSEPCSPLADTLGYNGMIPKIESTGILSPGFAEDSLDLKDFVESVLKNGSNLDEGISYTYIDTMDPICADANAFQRQLQQLSRMSGGDSELELSARTFLNNFKYFASDSEKYNRSFSLFLPLAYKSKAVLYAISGWGMTILNKDHVKAVKYLEKSMALCVEMHERLLKEPENMSQKEVVSLVGGLTCHVLAASSRGDSTVWKDSFERLYSTLSTIGIESFFHNVESSLGLFILNVLFYNDVLKVIKVTDDQKVGTLFPLSEYRKIISYFSNYDSKALDQGLRENSTVSTMELMDPVMGCCIGLFFRLAELNNLYDIFVAKIHNLVETWGPLRRQMDYMTEEEKVDFVLKPDYMHYEDVRVRFHDWIEVSAERLYKSISETLPHVSALTHIDSQVQRERHLTYFRVLQFTLLLFLQIKLKEAPLKGLRVKRLLVHCYRGLRQLICKEFSARLVFPLLVCGAAACEQRDRYIIKGLYYRIAEIEKSPNLDKAWEIIKGFWDPQCNFRTATGVISKFDWNICLL